jgi:predicted dehydrogenase
MVSGAEPLRLELEHFVDSVLTNTDPEVTGEEGLRNLELALRCLESLEAAHA